ncbi:MAG: major capsid protein [Wigfec virus K19_160]|nr:MAG: major capsid protein [Wigfec virus K19_160]
MKRSKFSLSNYKLFSCDMGELIPCGLTEVLPGDTIQQATSALVRCSPLLAPVMHPVHVHIRHFFVPHRLIWEDWEDFITGGPDGMDDSVFPTINLTYTNPTTGTNIVGQLPDYLGVPPQINNLAVSALPFRAYALIWNEWYRDQDLQEPLPLSVASGVDSTTNVALQNVNWEKDYFTSARPWEQKGPAITVPLGTRAPVKGIGVTDGTASNASASYRESDGSLTSYPNNRQTQNGNIAVKLTGTPVSSTNIPDVYADLTGASAVTVNILREALALQRYEEARARFGSRYTEYLRYLGVRSSDARLQRPEYLGGGRQTIQFSEVLQTAEGTDPVGQLRGHGISAMRSNRYRRFFEEHGYVMSFLSIRPKTMYMQSLHRTWNRRTKEDFWQKELQHIGQQEVLNKEVYAAHTTPNGVFGYQDRYDEYRRMENTVAGEFRTTELDYWHMARSFASSPALNSDFVECLPTERTFAAPLNDVIYVMAHHSIQARRMVAASGSSFIF